MKYREILELYKEKKLDEQQEAQIKADIEKQEAISDYLMEEEARLEEELEAAGEELLSSTLQESGGTQQDTELVKKIQTAIRRAFVRVGIIAGVTAVIVVVFALVVLPRIVDAFFYDPGKKIGENTNQMSLDMKVYTELTMPGFLRDYVEVDERGYGNYEIYIDQTVSVAGDFHNIAGKIEKNKMTLYDRNTLQTPWYNAFAWNEVYAERNASLRELQKEGNIEDIDNIGVSGGDKEGIRETLKELNPGDYYLAYVTLDRRMPYEEFSDYIDEHAGGNIWCTVSTNETDGDGNPDERYTTEGINLGFQCRAFSSCSLQWDKKKYPNLITWRTMEENEEGYDEYEKNWKKESYMKQHFVSMLRYMADQKTFMESIMNKGSGSIEIFDSMADYIEERGLLICGFAVVERKDTLLQLLKDKQIFEISIKTKV